MSRTKRWLEQQQQQYAEARFVSDGCPADIAADENWDSMVEAFYLGDYEAAWEEFQSQSLADICD